MTDADPFAYDPKRFVGRTVRFDHENKRLVGIVTAQQWAGRTQRGAIPDYTLTIRGQSGAILSVSLVESHASFSD